MAKNNNLGDYLTEIADAIREKKGTTEAINAQDFADEIASIEGGGDTSIEDSIVTREVTSYTNERVTSIGNQAFMNAASLKSISFPNAKSAGLSSFNACTSLTDVDLPLLESVNTQTFYGCNALVRLNLPKLKTASVQSVRNCAKLAIVDLGNATSISALSFDNCAALECFIIRTSSLCKLAATSALTNTKIASGTGYIYVPASLVDSYKNASNWSTYAGQIRAIEEYPDITNEP